MSNISSKFKSMPPLSSSSGSENMVVTTAGRFPTLPDGANDEMLVATKMK